MFVILDFIVPSMHSFLLAISPFIHTLAGAYSADTITALSVVAVSLHIISHDYRGIDQPVADVSSPVSPSSLPSASGTAAGGPGQGPGQGTERGYSAPRVRRERSTAQSGSASAGTRRAAGSTQAALHALLSRATIGVSQEASCASPSDPPEHPATERFLGLAQLPTALAGDSLGKASVDYRRQLQVAVARDAASVGGRFSLSCIVLATVLTAPRLPSPPFVFALLSVTCALFYALTKMLRTCRSHAPGLYLVLTLIGTAAAWVCLNCHSPILGYLFLFVVALVAVVSPACFLSMQRLKLELEGPWDYDDRGESGRENI